MTNNRRTFSPEFKLEAVQLVLDKNNNAIERTRAHNGINLPVTRGPACFYAGGTLGDVAFIREPAPAVISFIAFTPLLGRLPKSSPQTAPWALSR